MDNSRNLDFYRAFENRYRGSRELIKSRQRVYLPFIEPLLSLYEDAQAIDLGCGRGEWLELLIESGFNGHGVDLNDEMLAPCREIGLSVSNQDAISALKALPDESQIIVSGFHIAEHINFPELQILIQESLRVLKPAGLLILETPNPENIKVGTINFYIDPTHQKPIPPQLLSFLPEHYGFVKVKVLRLQEDELLASKAWTSLCDVLGGVSPDYAVVAQKGADSLALNCNSDAFAKEYGLTLDALIYKFDHQVKQASECASSAKAQAQQASECASSAKAQAQQASERAASAEAQAQQASERAASAEAQAQQASERAINAEAALAAVSKSRSWRLTAPLREVNAVLRPLIGRVVRSAVHKGKDFARRWPVFKRGALWLIRRFPVIERLVARFSVTPFSAALVQQAQIRHFEQLRSVRIMQSLSQLTAHETDGTVSFLKVSNDVS